MVILHWIFDNIFNIIAIGMSGASLVWSYFINKNTKYSDIKRTFYELSNHCKKLSENTPPKQEVKKISMSLEMSIKASDISKKEKNIMEKDLIEIEKNITELFAENSQETIIRIHSLLSLFEENHINK